jgi:hypothetical protein
MPCCWKKTSAAIDTKKMSPEFHASPDFTNALSQEITALDPCNPFCTPAYAQAMQAGGMQPWLLYTTEQGRITSACLALLKSGRLNCLLEIPSVPSLLSPDAFWTPLLAFCRQKGVTQLNVDSFGSSTAVIPSLQGEINRRERIEYVLDLAAPELWSAVATNHRRNSQKAQRAGVLVERTSSPESCQDHARLQGISMERRANRGEDVGIDAQTRTSAALLQHHAAEMFRATLDGQVLSSILILRSSGGTYYHSAGTSREGMAIGASHLLIKSVIEIVHGEGCRLFNLGGADPGNPGLERFKKGFGAQPVHLSAAQFYLGNRVRKSIGSMVDLVRRIADARRAPLKHDAAGHKAQPS